MPTFRRALGTSVLAALLAAGSVVVAPPALAAGPTTIDAHDSYVPTRAYDISSSAGGTLFGADVGGDHGRNYLVTAPMTTGSAPIDLGPGEWATVKPQIRGNRVAIPQDGPAWDSPVTQVKNCAVGTCPTMSTYTVPAGGAYVGNGEDRAIVWSVSGSDSLVRLYPWAGGAASHTFTLPGVTTRPHFAEGDVNGLVVAAGGDVFYLDRFGGATLLGSGNDVHLTGFFAVWWELGAGPDGRTVVRRVLRNTPTATPVEQRLPGDPSVDSFAANDAGFAYLVPNGDAGGTSSLYSATWDATPSLYARPITTNGLTEHQGGSSFLVNDRRAGIPGFYTVGAGAASGTLAGLVPVRPAKTLALAASNGRAAYLDDMTADNPLFVRTVPNASPGPESLVTSHTEGTSVALSGPFVVFTRPGTTSGTTQVVFGRTEGPFTTRTLPAAEVGTVGISGRTVYVTNGSRARLIDVLTNTVTDLGNAYVGAFGRYVVTMSYANGEIRRRDTVTGTNAVIRPAISGCPAVCIDEERVQISVWGNEVVYAFQAAAGPAAVAEIWSGTTGMTGSLSALVGTDPDSGLLVPKWYQLKYWGGLLLVAHVGGEVTLYDVRVGAPTGTHTYATNAENPLALDGHVAGWRPNADLRAVVQDVTDAFKDYVASPRYLGTDAPAGFAPDAAEWAPRMWVSQDVTWTLVVREGGLGGEIVHVAEGTSVNGEVQVKPWDGTDERTGEQAPQGTYTWQLAGSSLAGAGAEPLRQPDGSSAAIAGTFYLSRTPLPAPVVNAPTRSTDTSASTAYGVSWTTPPGAPAGTRYRVERSTNGGAFTSYATTAATSLTAAGTVGQTYRFRVRAVDPAGRLGALSAADATMVPHDPAGTVSGTWSTVSGASYYRGSQRRASAAGATFAFSATGTQIHLVGTRGAAYGKFYVSIDGGAYAGPFDSVGRATAYRQVLYTKTGLSAGTHTVKVKVAGTSGRPYVGIDGIAYLR